MPIFSGLIISHKFNMKKTLYALSYFSIFFLGLIGSLSAQEKPLKRIILIGDAGGLIDNKNPVIDAVASKYDFNDKTNTLIYLGDNLYPMGLYRPTNPLYEKAVAILNYQASIGINKKADVIFIPGNHDWAQGTPDGFERIVRQMEYLQSLNSPNVRLLPQDGCPGPVEIALDNDVTLVVLDSQWWLHPYNKPGANSDCDCTTEDEVLTRLNTIAYKNRFKSIIIATHHPFRSYGSHGGYYTAKQHIFPLTDVNPKLYIPLPLIGSIYPISRGVFGNIQDLPHPTYREMVKKIENVFKDNKQVIFVAGHEHGMQHLKDKGFNYLVSGAGYHEDRVNKGKKSEFAGFGLGYGVIEHFKDGTMKASFVSTRKDSVAKTIYETNLFTIKNQVLEAKKEIKKVNFPDSIVVSADLRYDSVGKNYRKFMGNNYRDIWALPVKTKVFDISKEKGGFEILERGGGNQTKSLRLKSKDGLEWALRTITKVPDKVLPQNLRETVAKDILQDQISAANPYAPLVVSALIKPTGIPQAEAEIVFVPDDPQLKEFQKDFANTLCILERREPVMPGETKTTPKMVKELRSDNDNSVDQKAVAKARLFDFLIGDWDRHDDQWRWGYRKKKKGKEFFPIPRDRDEAFFVNEGIVPKFVSQKSFFPMFEGFKPKVKDINGFMRGGRVLDREYTNQLTKKDWEEIALELQQEITDEEILNAVSKFPKEIGAKTRDFTIASLKGRRDDLVKQAGLHYIFLAEDVDVIAYNKQEKISIETKENGEVTVNINKIAKDDEIKQNVYSRKFDPKETKEVKIFAEKGEDVFEVADNYATSIRIKMIGGDGTDTFRLAGATANKQKYFLYDEKAEKNIINKEGKGRLKYASAKENKFDSYAYKYNTSATNLALGYNRDDGLILGLSQTITRYGYLKYPYKNRQKITVGHSVATKAYYVKYDAQFTDVFGNADLLLNFLSFAPNNTSNFFGFGNNSVYDKNNSIRFYRTRYNYTDFYPAISVKPTRNVVFNIGPSFQYFNVDEDENEGRFILTPLLNQQNPGLLQRKVYTGIQSQLIIDNRDNATLPKRGIHWESTLRAMEGLSKQSNRFLQLKSELSLFTSFYLPSNLVIANRIGAGFTIGDPSFFQYYYLGGKTLQGYRQFRFGGTGMFYHNIELRLKLFDFKSYLFPGSIGIIAFNDTGRVSIKNETSNRWHHGYGGGFYLSPINKLALTATLGHSREGTYPYVSFGFRF